MDQNYQHDTSAPNDSTASSTTTNAGIIIITTNATTTITLNTVRQSSQVVLSVTHDSDTTTFVDTVNG